MVNVMKIQSSLGEKAFVVVVVRVVTILSSLIQLGEFPIFNRKQ